MSYGRNKEKKGKKIFPELENWVYVTRRVHRFYTRQWLQVEFRKKKMQRFKAASLVRNGLHSCRLLSHCRGLCSLPDHALNDDLDHQVSFCRLPISLFFLFKLRHVKRKLSESIRYWLKAKLGPGQRFSTDLQRSMLSRLQWCVFIF